MTSKCFCLIFFLDVYKRSHIVPWFFAFLPWSPVSQGDDEIFSTSQTNDVTQEDVIFRLSTVDGHFGFCRFEDKKKRGGTRDFKEKQTLLHKLKKEKKGALREIRKDSQFLARVKLNETIERFVVLFIIWVFSASYYHVFGPFDSATKSIQGADLIHLGIGEVRQWHVRVFFQMIRMFRWVKFLIYSRDSERKRKVKDIHNMLANQEGEFKALKRPKKKSWDDLIPF